VFVVTKLEAFRGLTAFLRVFLFVQFFFFFFSLCYGCSFYVFICFVWLLGKCRKRKRMENFEYQGVRDEENNQ
jgi:hypothetical protein